MKRIIRLTENDLTKLIKRILVESELNEPNLTSNNYYESFDDAYSFMLELDEYLNNLAPSDEVCDEKHLNMLQRIYDTADKMVVDLRKKYKSTIDQPSEKAFADGSIDQKINDFIKKYDYLPDNKFYEFAELLSKEIGVTVEDIRKKRLEFINKKFSKFSKPTKWDDKAVRKDPLHIKAQQMFEMAGGWLDCCKKGYYDCDDNNDDDPPFNFPPKKNKDIDVKYEPTIKGGGNVPSEFDGGKKGGEPGVPMNEQIKKLIRKLL
jgi:hypothetical protein